MTHNMHILLGNYAEQNIYRLKEYIIKYGQEYKDPEGRVAADFLKFMLFGDDGQMYEACKKEASEDEFTSGLEDLYAVELISCNIDSSENPEKVLQHFFNQQFSKTVNMQNPGDGSLHVCIHVPLFVENAWEQAQRLMTAIKASKARYTVDLLLLASDLAYLFVDEQELISGMDKRDSLAKQTLNQIIKTKTSGTYANMLYSLILIENHNQSGIALDLSPETYTNIVGEYALTTAVYYNDIYTPAYLLATYSERPVIGMGISMIHFDRFFFVQYMLRKAYNYILSREGIGVDTIDGDKVSPIVQGVLRPNINIFTTIYDKEVKPRLEKRMSNDDIIAEMGDVIKGEMERLKEEFLSITNREELNLPEKRVAMAQMLGEDDVMLEGTQADIKKIIIDECRREVLDYFVDANNKLAEMSEEDVDSSETPMHDYAVLSELSEGLPQPVESAAEKLAKIKEKKRLIKDGTDYIRRTTKELKRLGDNIHEEEDSHKRLTNDGFEFQGKRYIVMPKNIERPLEETFEPGTAKIPASVDLRQNFTYIKDQGQLGSCTAFAVVSIYEYILKKNSKKDVDLSELFAYYNARKRNEENPEEEGTSIYNMIKGMGEDGICLEELHPYRASKDIVEPSQEAYAEAETRKITKALNVRCDINDIKAAVAQGYPVVISLMIYDSFHTETGFIHTPSAEERENEAGGHAMVICGYSDENKVFVVRNSWGMKFGDMGYCYIPYSYVGDTSLLRNACIITEISLAEMKVSGQVEKVSVSFNLNDAKVHSDILRTKIEEEECNVRVLEEELAVLRRDYLEMVTQLGRPQVRETLSKGTQERLSIEVKRLRERKEALETERMQRLDEFESGSRKLYIWTGLGALALVIVYTLLKLWIEYVPFQEYLSTWGILNMIQIGGILTLVLAPIVSTLTGSYVTGERYDRFSKRITTMWNVWSAIMFAYIVVYVFLSLYKIIDPFPISGLNQFVTALLCYIPYVFCLFCRKRIEEEIKEAYDEDMAKLSLEIVAREREYDLVTLKTHITGRILDSLAELISFLSSKYYSLCSYVDNLKTWYDENKSMEDMVPVNRQPFMSLTNKESLDKFFEVNAEGLTEKIYLYKLFTEDNYTISEEKIVKFKNALKKTLQKQLWAYTDDFSIYEHVTQTKKFAYVDNQYVDINKLLQTMDRNSEIFVRTSIFVSSIEVQNAKSKLLFREAPGNDGFRDWDASVNVNFGVTPTSRDLSSPYKVFIIRLEGLTPSEINLLQ